MNVIKEKGGFLFTHLDYYEVLGIISTDVSKKELILSYQNALHNCENEFKQKKEISENRLIPIQDQYELRLSQIKEAYEVLSNPEKKKAYDNKFYRDYKTLKKERSNPDKEVKNKEINLDQFNKEFERKNKEKKEIKEKRTFESLKLERAQSILPIAPTTYNRLSFCDAFLEEQRKVMTKESPTVPSPSNSHDIYATIEKEEQDNANFPLFTYLYDALCCCKRKKIKGIMRLN